jgi:tetratricopeptide (TPR) repeat protein
MGPNKLADDLRADLVQGNVLVVVGTGVSIQATGHAECARWDGLLLHGIEYCSSRRFLSADDARVLREQLTAGEVEERLKVAERISEALKATRPGEFRRWLFETVGRLKRVRRDLIDAIHDLGFPIATTNYDDLLTRERGIAHVPWTDVDAAHEFLRGHPRDVVLHFHGCYDHPESIVLGIRSYEKVLESGGAQAIQQASVANKTLLFIGCGDGLSDPNFGALLRWSADAFGGSIYRHYCLCLASEREELQKRLPAGVPLLCVEYGSAYDELVPFLRSLVPPKSTYVLPNPGYCFGREREVAEVVEALLADKPQPLPILGGPGMGKTTIALKALHEKRVAERFRDRRWFVRCDGVKSRKDLAGAIAGTLDLPITPSVEQTVLEELATAPAALVLDNAETPLDADGPKVEELLSMLANIESLALVVTIRSRKRPRGVPWRTSTEPQRLADTAAAETFVAVSGKPQFATDPDLSRLLVALDGVPLAVTLMARFAEVFESLQPVWQRWTKKRAEMLRDGEEPDRLKNIAVSYELSIGVLSEGARRLLSVLAMLPGGVADIDLEGVFADPDEPADELRRRALVFEEGPRLRMLAPLREYVMAAHPPEEEDARRVMEHYLGLAGSEGGKVGAVGGAGAVSRLVPELSNMQAMLARSVATPYDKIARSVLGWTEFMRFTGLGSTESIEEIAQHAFIGGLTIVAAECFDGLGRTALAHSDYEKARAHFERAIPLWRSAGCLMEEARCIVELGTIALEQSDYDAARTQFDLALPMFQQVGHLGGEATCLVRLADIALVESELANARAQYEQALQLYKHAHHLLGEANCMLRLGDLAFEESDFEGARVRCEQALPLYQETGNPLGAANCIARLGRIAFRRGDRDDAEAKYLQALTLYKQCRDPYSIGLAHEWLAHVVTDDAARSAHLAAARAAWLSIKRDDLVAELDAEFGAG